MTADHGIQFHELRCVKISLRILLIRVPLFLYRRRKICNRLVVRPVLLRGLELLLNSARRLELVLLLLLGAGRVHTAFRAVGVAADHCLTLENQNLFAGIRSFDRGCHARAARTYNDNVCVVGGVFFLLLCFAAGCRSQIQRINIYACTCKRRCRCRLDCVRSNRRAADAVNIGRLLINNCSGNLFKRGIGNSLRLLLLGYLNLLDRLVRKGNLDLYLSVLSLRGAFIFAGLECYRRRVCSLFLKVCFDRVRCRTAGNKDLDNRVATESVTAVNASGHLAGRIETCDLLTVRSQNMTVCVNRKSAHRVVRGRSHHTNAQLDAVQLVRGRVVIVLRILIRCADDIGSLGLLHFRRLFAGHNRLVILFDRIVDDRGIRLHTEIVKDLSEFFLTAREINPSVNGFLAGYIVLVIVVRIRASDHDVGIGDFKEYALCAVDFDTVLKFAERQNITFRRLIDKSLTCCRVDVNRVRACAEGQISVIDPGDRHHLCPACAFRGCACVFAHLDAVALQRAAVGCLCIVCDVLGIPVFVGILDHLNISCVTAGSEDHTLFRVNLYFRAIVLPAGNTGYLSVFHDQILRLGPEHDLVVLGRRCLLEQRILRSCEIRAPLRRHFCLAVAVKVSAAKLVFSVPERADQRRLARVIEHSSLIFEPFLESLSVIDELGNQIVITVDPFRLIRALAESAVIGLEDVQVHSGKQCDLIFRLPCVQLRLRPVQILLDLFL